MDKIAKLALEDGTVYTGYSFGGEGEAKGEVVFNTAMTGYQEILTDPSYKGQIVTMTYTQIGNYGVNAEDVESDRPWVEGFICREASKWVSNWRATEQLSSYLKRHGIVALEGIDTRDLTKKLRINGSMNGVISTVDADDQSLISKAKKVPSMKGLDLVKLVSRVTPTHYTQLENFNYSNSVEPKFKVALIDCGAKYNIVRLLITSGCDVTIFPAFSTAEEIASGRFDGIVVSNGPGDPEVVTCTIETIKGLVKKGLPIFGICLGHQLLAHAFGASTYKLKFGHHGANHPVKNLSNGHVEITSQNHGFAVDEQSAIKAGFEITHINLNDSTIEGISHRHYPAFAVQYHPEASPGPHDSRYLFNKFTSAMAVMKGLKTDGKRQEVLEKLRPSD